MENDKKEIVIATGDNLVDALTDALLKIKPRSNIIGKYKVTIEIEVKEWQKQPQQKVN